jgi:DNA-binding CsgD family transcriptional regulator
MEELLYLLVLFLCLASSAGSVLLSQKLKVIHLENIFESLFYYVILISFFGFYGIWGQVIIQNILNYLSASPDIIFLIGQLIPLLGIPFLIMGGYMLIRFGNELWGQKIGRISSVAFYLFYLVLLFILGWISFHDFRNDKINLENPLIYLIVFFMIQEIVIHVWFLILQVRQIDKKQNLSSSSYIGRFTWIFFIFLVLKLGTMSLLFFQFSLTPLFILFYYLSFVTPLVYLYRYHRNIVYETQPHITLTDKKESILKRNGITKREKEIIELICTGKTNQEIADLLFISLQTVKDHTHRIYLKLEVKNRMQLIHLLRNP